MTPGEAVPRSPLEKPLNQLTEDDISQLTREDCRRFLKEKGMRRPSWNKSQAIQQVISLKALLETAPDSEVPPDSSFDGRKLVIPHRVALPSSAAAAAAVPDSNSSRMPRDSPKREFSGDPPDGHIGTDSFSPRITTNTNGPIGQMTIFYSGKVNVYDDVPREKAWTIMQLAASPFHFPQEGQLEENAALRPCSFHPSGTSVKVASNSPVVVFPALQTVNVADASQLHKDENYTSREDNLDGPSSRKASVQRYLEKRKDRFKRKVAMPSSTGLDIYLNHRIGDRISNEQSGRGDVYCPSQAPQQMPIQSSPGEDHNFVFVEQKLENFRSNSK